MMRFAEFTSVLTCLVSLVSLSQTITSSVSPIDISISGGSAPFTVTAAASDATVLSSSALVVSFLGRPLACGQLCLLRYAFE